MFENPPPNLAEETALGLLNKKTLSMAQLRSALEEKGFPSPHIETTLHHMSHLGYLNDDAIGTRLLEEALRKKRGWLWLRKRLIEKEISSEIIEKLFEESQKTAYERANESLQAKRRNKSLSQDQAFRFLLNRGFELELVRDVIQSEFRESFPVE